MNLYLLTQDENDGYDTYDSCVVAAKTERSAQRIHPSPYDKSWNAENRVWASSPENVKVKRIGTALRKTAGVILTSFNAG